MNQIQTQKEVYYKQQGIAPGVPTMKGAYGDPENTGVGYNAVLTELGNHDVPQGWIQTPRPNTTPGTNPSAPVSWNDPSNPDDPQAGYGYIPNDTTKEETFFYHSDHLGSTSYITDNKANITQYDAYLPYGELLVDEHSSSEDLPYKFNGKQFDDETGLYYYGARYLNPMTSLWYGVDPLAEKYVTTSGYIYTLDNPIRMIDMDGREWYESSVTQKNGNVTINLILTVAILNSSNKKFDLKKLGNVLSNQLQSSYGISYVEGMNYKNSVRQKGMDNLYVAEKLPTKFRKVNVNVSVRFRTIRNKSELQDREHLLNILPASQLQGVYGKVNEIGGSVIFLNERYVNNIINGKDRNTLPHEFGHSLGLLHIDGADAWLLGLFGQSQYYDSYKQERNRYNVMFSGANSKYTDDYKSTDINPEQISIIPQIRSTFSCEMILCVETSFCLYM